ncbi:MAG: ribose-5-phosphate isomerase RpiA [Hyphomicrobiales bacterium]|nr:ribose-5-phosphate isomerase RpiA [Hyphomicrobiales bacterium]
MSSKLERKQAAAEAALESIRKGCRLGLGCGSTVNEFIRLLGEKVRRGFSVRAIAACTQSEAVAREAGVPLEESSEDLFPLDVLVDGADEVDIRMRLIKGGGGALLHEKVLAFSTYKFIVIAEGEKLVDELGKFPLPVEVAPFGFAGTLKRIRKEAARVGCVGDIALRRDGNGKVFVSDAGHWICDCAFGNIPDPESLSIRLDNIAGVMGHGLFLRLASVVLLGKEDGVMVLGDSDGLILR